MSDLSEEGKALVQAGRRADRPSDADRKRVLVALQARLGDAALLGASVAEVPSASKGVRFARSKIVKWSLVGSTVLVAGAALLVPRLGSKSEETAPRASASVAVSAATVPAVPAPVVAAPELPSNPGAPLDGAGSTRPATADGSSRPDAQKAPSRSRDGLGEEVALLSRAETELHAGRPAKALVALAEHQRKFPRGALAEERTAAKIQALCALGRNEEANAQLRQLLHISPKSALEERSRQACR